jgi:hypothetical protein
MIDPMPFRTTGRTSRELVFAQVRELDTCDVAMLGEEKGVQSTPLKRLSDRHHALARCLASGMAECDAAIACGYVLSRVSVLKSDPAFQELLAFYRADTDNAYRDLHSRLAGLSMDAADELTERLEADMQAEIADKKISIGQLMEITKLGADRTGHGPQSSSTNLNVNVDLAGRLEAARRRVEARKLEI